MSGHISLRRWYSTILRLKLILWDLRCWRRRWIHIVFARGVTHGHRQYFSRIHVPKMILKSVSSCVIFQNTAIFSPRGGENLPSIFNSVFGIFLTKRVWWRWCTMTSCASALLFCGARYGNQTTPGKESEPAPGDTHIWSFCFPSDWAMHPGGGDESPLSHPTNTVDSRNEWSL